MTRPLPWHDTPTCREPGCGGPIVVSPETTGCHCHCGACGKVFRPTPGDRARIATAEAAWELVLAGKVHEDKACARCGGVLPIEQQRLCPPCVTRDAEERTLSLFPEAPHAP
jgi:hypothetical protein